MQMVISDDASNASTPGETVLVCFGGEETKIRGGEHSRRVFQVWQKGRTDVVGIDVLVHVLVHFFADQTDVATEVFRREAKLDKLFLLHQDVVRHVVDDLRAEDAVFPRGGVGKRTVSLAEDVERSPRDSGPDGSTHGVVK